MSSSNQDKNYTLKLWTIYSFKLVSYLKDKNEIKEILVLIYFKNLHQTALDKAFMLIVIS